MSVESPTGTTTRGQVGDEDEGGDEVTAHFCLGYVCHAFNEDMVVVNVDDDDTFPLHCTAAEWMAQN